MTDEKKQEYTRRITQANASKLVVILYELFFDFSDEALEALAKKDIPTFSMQLDKAQEALNQLIGSLQEENDLADSIYRVYLYVSARMGLIRANHDPELLTDPLRLMKSLFETYSKDSENDTSGPVMDNSQKVYAGLTYGKEALTESMDEGAGNRGFFA